jgi:hypothetical protein
VPLDGLENGTGAKTICGFLLPRSLGGSDVWAGSSSAASCADAGDVEAAQAASTAAKVSQIEERRIVHLSQAVCGQG